VRLEDLPCDALVLAEDGPPALVAEAGHHLGVADEVNRRLAFHIAIRW